VPQRARSKTTKKQRVTETGYTVLAVKMTTTARPLWRIRNTAALMDKEAEEENDFAGCS
jgi:hypothetical protein